MVCRTSALGGSKKQQEAGEGEAAFIVARVGTGPLVHRLGRHAQHAEALAAPVAEPLLDPGPPGVVQRQRFRPGLHPAADAQDVVQRALGDEGALAPGVGGDHAQALAHEVVGDLVHLLLAADIQPGLLPA